MKIELNDNAAEALMLIVFGIIGLAIVICIAITGG
jgi:hypothetical protein